MTLFEIAAKLMLDTAAFVKGTVSAAKEGEGLAGKLNKSFEKAKKAFTSIVNVDSVKKLASSMNTLAKNASDVADNIDKQSQKLGMSRKAFQEWDYILNQNGASIDGMSSAMKTLQKNMQDMSATGAAAYKRLGMSVKDLKGMSPEAAFEATVRALQQLPEGVEKSALAIDLFGNYGMELIPLLNQSSDSIDQLRESAEKLGLVISDDMVDAGAKYNDTMDNFHRTTEALKTTLGAKLLPAITPVIDKFTEIISTHAPGLSDAFGTVVEAAQPVVDALLGMVDNGLKWISENGESIGPILTTIGIGLGAILAAVFPIPAAIAAVTAGIVALISEWDNIKAATAEKLKLAIEWVKDRASQAKEWALGVWNAAKNAVKETIKLVMGWDEQRYQAAIKWAKGVWTAAWTAIKDAIELVIKWDTFLFLKAAEWAMGIWDAVVEWMTATFGIDLPNAEEIIKAIHDWWAGIKSALGLSVNYEVYPHDNNAGSEVIDYAVKKVDSEGAGAITYDDVVSGRLRESAEIYNRVLNGGPDQNTVTRVTQPKNKVGGQAKGLDYVPYDMLTQVHKGEAIIKASENYERMHGDKLDMDAFADKIVTGIVGALSGLTVSMDGEHVGMMVADTVDRAIADNANKRRYAW